MKKSRQIITLGISILFVAATLFGCAKGTASKDASMDEMGTIHLRVNPEISIRYDKDGLVTLIKGENDDGEKIVADYKDFVGKDAREVVKELIIKIHEAGYFVSDIDGSKRNITIEIEDGSVLPLPDFAKMIAKDVRSTLRSLDLDVQLRGIDASDYSDYDDSDYYASDYDDSGYPNAERGEYITLARAKEIALAHANVNAANAVFDDKDFDLDDGRAVYELEFKANGVEYEYDIDARTGNILKYKHVGKNAGIEPGRNDYSDYDDDNTNFTDDTDYDDDSDYGTKSTTRTTTRRTAAKKDDSNYDDDDSDYDDDDDSDYGTKSTTRTTTRQTTARNDHSDYDDASDYDDDNDDSDYDND